MSDEYRTPNAGLREASKQRRGVRELIAEIKKSPAYRDRG